MSPSKKSLSKGKSVKAKAAAAAAPFKIANPGPLGLCGFALTTFVLSMMNAGVIVSKYLFCHMF